MNLRKFYPLALGFSVTGLLVLAIATKPKPDQDETLETSKTNSIENMDHPNPVDVESKFSQNSNSAPSKPQTEVVLPPETLSPVEKFVFIESQKVKKPDPNPELTYSRFKKLAQELRSKDIEALKSTALDPSMNNDRRFMSVYLLSLHQKEAVLPALMSIALDSVIVSENQSEAYAEELMLRTQALMGIAQFQAPIGNGPLHSYLRKQENSFLADQARRLLKERQARL